MNEVMTSLISRKSVRAFTSQAITPEHKLAILTAALHAPTAGNQQLYTILDITDQSLKDTLAKTCDNQPFIATAPLVLIFCADQQKWLDAFQTASCQPRMPGKGDLLLAVEDALCAAQNTVTAAWSFGIGSCYIGDIMENCELHRELLSLPNFVYPAAMLVFGYPTPQQANREKPQRFDLSHIVHENAYRRMQEPELRAMFEGRSQTKGFDAWLAAFYKRKYNSDFALEMNRSAAKYLEAFDRVPKTNR